MPWTLRLLTLLCMAFPAVAQKTHPDFPKSDVKAAVNTYIDDCLQVSLTNKREFSKRDLAINYGAEMVPELERFYGDDARSGEAHRILSYIGAEGRDSETRTAAMSCVVRHIDNAISLKVYFSTVVSYYSGYRSAEFGVDARNLLREQLQRMVERKASERSDIVLLCGASGDISYLPLLKEIDKCSKPSEDESNSLNWRVALRACARIGDGEAIRQCIQLADASPKTYLKVRNLKPLSYIRQPEVIEYIKPFLFSDEREPDESNDVYGANFHELATEALHVMLPDFPYTGKLEDKRKWISEQKEWKLRR